MDLGDVTFLDATALGLLVALRTRQQEWGEQLALRNTRPELMPLLHSPASPPPFLERSRLSNIRRIRTMAAAEAPIVSVNGEAASGRVVDESSH